MKRIPLSPRALAPFFLMALSVSVWSQEGNDKAQRYYESLLKRPVPGAAFDRFYGAWLDTDTLDSLEKWLLKQADAADAPVGSRLLLAYFYSRQSEPAKAIEQFNKALAKEPENAEAWYQKAMASARLLDSASALKDLEKATNAKPSKLLGARIRQAQGRLLARQGQPEEARKIWQELMAASPDDEDLAEDLIDLQITEGLYEDALATTNKLLATTKDAYKKVQRKLRLAEVFMKSGKRDEAVKVWRDCLEDTGSDSWLEKEILAQLELAFRREDAMTPLLDEMSALSAKYPQRLSLRRNYAKLLAETGDTDSAVKVFQGILDLTPGDRGSREAFVDLLKNNNRPADAAAQLEELVKLNASDLELLSRLADLQAENGEKDKARASMELFLTKSDQSEASWLRVAAALERYGLPEDSLAQYEKSASRFPDSESVRDAWAVALHAQGKKEEAFRVWRTLAKGADGGRLASVVRSVSARGEHELAYELLKDREADFARDPLFLTLLCDEAVEVGKADEALPWARQLVVLSRDAVDLETSVGRMIKLADRSEKVDDLRNQLQAETLTPQEKCLLAELLDRHADPKAADALLQEVGAAEPELATALLVRLQGQRNDYVGAAESLKKLVESPGGRKSVHVQRLVELYRRAGKAEEALAWIPEWKKLSPGSVLPWQTEADLQFDAGKGKEALRALRQAAQEFEGNEDIKAMLASAYQSEGQLADAQRIYMALYESAEDTSARIRWAGAMADVAQDSGKAEDLVETFQQRHRANRNSLAPLLALAEIYRVTDNYDGRRKALLDAVQVKPGDVELLMEIARLAEREEKYDDALQTLRGTLPLDKSGKVRQMITRILFAAGREEEGMQGLRDYFAGTPDARAVENVADSLVSQKLWGRAADFLLEQLPAFPDNYRLYYYCAVALEEDGRGVGSFDPAAAPEESKTGKNGQSPPQGPGAVSLLLKVQGMTKELPVPTVPGPGTLTPVRPTGPNYFDEMAKVLPREAMQITRLTNSAYQAYQYRQRNQRVSAAGGFGGGLNVPQKLDDVKAMAQVHLLSLGQELSPEGQTRLEEELTAGGLLPHARWLMNSGLGQVAGGNRQLDFTEMLEKNPEDESLNALLVLRGANDQNILPEQLLEARRVLVKNWPVMARMAGLGLARGESEEAQAVFGQTVEELVADENPPGMVLMNGITQLLYQMNNRRGQAMPEASRTKFAALQKKILPWLRADDQQRGNLSYIFLQLAAGLADSDGDLTPLVNMLDDEIAYWEAEPDKNAALSRIISPGTSRVPPVVQEMPFPPEKLPDFPPQVLQVLNGQGLRMYGLTLASDPEQWKKALPSVRDPLLRVLVAGMTDEEAEIRKALQALNSAPEPKAAGLMLAAAYAGKQEKYAEAVGWLLKAQDLPLARDIRRTMDSACLAWSVKVLEEKPGTPETDPVRQAGRESALRMRRENLNSGQRSELAEVFETMGLTREAERMAASAASAPAGPRGGSSVSTMISGFSNNRSQLQQLVDKGKRADAVKISLRQLHDYSRTWISNNDGSIRYMTQEWLQEVRRSALLRDLQEALRAETKDDAASLAQRGAAWEIIGDTKTALPLYRAALGKKPKDSGVQIALAFALMAKQPKEALPILSEIDASQFAGMTYALQNMANQIQDFEGRFVLLEVVTAIVDRITPEQAVKQDLSWALYMMESVVQQGYSNTDGFQIGSLYEEGNEGEGEPPAEGKTDPNRAKIETAQNRRLELHAALCRSLMRLPGVADQAFRRYSGVAQSKGLKNPSAAELDKLAMQVLEVEGRKRNGSSNAGRRYYYSNNRAIRMTSPEEWLLDRAWQEKKPERVTTELIPAVRKQGPPAVRAMEELQELYFCADADFGKEVAEYLKRRQRTQIQGEPQTHLETVLRIMSLRGLEADLTDAVADSVEAVNGTYFNGQELNPALDYAGYLMERKGPEATQAFLSRITEIILGPKAKRGDFLEKNYQPNGFSSNSGMSIYRWIQMLRTGVNRGPLVLPLFALLENEFIPYLKPPNDNQVILHNYGSAFQRANALPDKPQDFLKFIRNTPLVADAAGFRSFPDPRQSTQSPVVEVLRRLSNLQHRKEIADAVDTLPKTFGTELITLILRGDPGKIADSVAGALTAHLDEIKALPPEKWGNFTILRKAFATGNPTDATTAFDAWSKELQAQVNTKETEKLLAAKVAKDLAPGDSQLTALVQPAVSGMVLTGDARLEESLLKVRSLFAAERKSRGVNQSNSNDGSSVMNVMLTQALQQKLDFSVPEKAAKSVEGLLNALASPEGYPIEWSLGTSEKFQKLLLPAMTVEVEKKRTTRLKAFADSVKLTEPACALLIGPLRHVLADKNLTFCAEDTAWLDAGPHDAPGVLGLILAVHPQAEKDMAPSGVAEGDRAAAWIEDRLKNGKLPPHVRFGLLLEALKDSKNPAWTMVSAAVAHLSETWKEGNPVTDADAGLVISSLNAALEKADAAFLETARPAASDLAAGWRRSIADATRNPGSYGYRPLRVMRNRTSRAFLSLFLTMNDASGLNSLLNAMGVQVDRSWLAELVAHGQDDAARRLVVPMRPGLLANQSDPAFYSKALADHLPAFLAGISDERARIMAEAVLVSLPDPEQPKEQGANGGDKKANVETSAAPPAAESPVNPRPDMTGVPDRKARMAALLEHVPLDAFKTRSELEPLVILLKDEQGLSDKMETLISRYVEGDSLAAAGLVEDQTQRELRCLLLRKEVIKKMKSGDIPAVEAALRDLDDASQGGQNYYVKQEAQKLYPLLQESILTSWNDWKPEVRIPVRHLWLSLSLDAGKTDPLENVDTGRIGLSLFLYALEDDMKSFVRAVTSRPAVVREEFRDRMAAVELKNITDSNKYPWTGTPEEIATRKSEIFLRVLSQPVILPGVKPLEGRYFKDIADTGWIGRDELLAQADRVVTDGPQDAATPGEMAIFQATAGKPEAADKNLALTLSRQSPDDYTGAAKVVLLRSTVLEKQGKAVEALTLVREFKPSETLEKPLREGLISRVEDLKLIVTLQSSGPEKLLAGYIAGLTEKPGDAGEWMKVEGGFELSGQYLMDKGDAEGAARHFGMAAVIVSKLAAKDPEKYRDELRLPAKGWQDAAKAAKLPGAPRTLVAEGAAWSYAESVPADWNAVAFDDAAWKSGPAPVGYGESWLKTNVSPGAQKPKPVALFLRTSFETKDPGGKLSLQLQRDDGAVVYLNGTEIARANLPEGPIKADSPATSTVSDGEERKYTRFVIKSKDLLVAGKNTIAVELHQDRPDSSDLSMDLSLSADDLEPGEAVQKLDSAAIATSLGQTWSQLPAAFRDLIVSQGEDDKKAQDVKSR